MTTKKTATKKFRDGTTRDDDFGGYMIDHNPELKAKLDKVKADAKKSAAKKQTAAKKK